MTPEQIRNKFDQLESDRKTLDGTLELIKEFMMPLRSEFYTWNSMEGQVDWTTRHLFDSTAVDSIDTLSASMQGSLTSMATRWFEVNIRDKELMKEYDVIDWCQQVSEIMFKSIQESNFNVEASEFYLDLVGYGTAIMTEEEDPDETGKLIFDASPLDACYFEEDASGRIARFYRRYMWTPLQCVDKFGRDGVTENIRNKLDGDSLNKIPVILAIYKRDNVNQADSYQRLAPSARQFGYKYIEHASSSQLGEEGGYYELPAYVSRWRKTPGSVWGYSPSHICLSDVLTLNALVRDLLEVLGKIIDPTILTTRRNLLTDLNLGRGKIAYCRDPTKVIPFETRMSRTDLGDLKVAELRGMIRRAYRIDQLELKESPAMTATEVNVRYEMMQRLLGPTMGRLTADFLDPLVERTFAILFRAGALPELPQVLLENQAAMDIEYTGPMSRSQRSLTAMSIREWLAEVLQLTEANPEVLDLIDFDEVVRGIASYRGVPQSMLKDENEVQQAREQRQEAAEQQQQLNQAEQGSAAVKNLAQGMQAVR